MAIDEFSACVGEIALAFGECVSGIMSLVSMPLDYHRGHCCGLFGFDRDWSEPDAWHRGFLRGRLERIRLYRLDSRDADQDPHQVDIGGEG